ELGPNSVLVSEHRFEHDLHPASSTLQAVHYTGFRRDTISAQVTKRSLPPLRFTYSAPTPAHAFESLPVNALENVPQGLNGPRYRWIDLYGEGLPGILSDTGSTWYYKSNEGRGRFGRQQLVLARPACPLGQCALTDFDSDGNANLAILHGRQGGFYE